MVLIGTTSLFDVESYPKLLSLAVLFQLFFPNIFSFYKRIFFPSISVLVLAYFLRHGPYA